MEANVKIANVKAVPVAAAEVVVFAKNANAMEANVKIANVKAVPVSNLFFRIITLHTLIKPCKSPKVRMFIKQQTIVQRNALVIGLNLVGLGPYYAISKRLKIGSYIISTVILLVFIISCVLHGVLLLTFYNFKAFAYFQRALLSCLLYICFLIMIKIKWDKIQKLWYFSELVPSARGRIYEIYGIFLVNIAERCYFLTSVYNEIIQKNGSFSFEDYFDKFCGGLNDYFERVPTINFVIFLFTFIALLIHSLINAFLSLLITKFVSQLEHFNMMINRHISKSNGLYVEHNHCIKAKVEYYWMCSRKEYNKLNVTDELVEFRHDNLIVLVSETMRLRSILMTAADIPETHRRIVDTMFKLSQYDYNLESSLLLKQVTLTRMNIKIAGIFEATRDFILTLVEYMVSYNLIILQLLPYLISSFRFTDEDGIQKIISERNA
ncbi:Trehalose receptor [Popillia japonica]|uniref:Trehalose receptor n=1 Tax=Popillia japonica TaxID=7064 RepID=A0AAW1KK34_POPJA